MTELWHAHLAFLLLAYVAIPGTGLSLGAQLVRLIGLVGISLIQIEGLSLAAYIGSFTGSLSVTSLVVLTFAVLLKGGVPIKPNSTARLQVLIVLAGLALFLYPATMGLSQADPYRLGFQPRLLILIIGLITLVFLALQNFWGAGLLGIVTLAYCLDVKPSHNYWDYLVDPFIALYCVGTLAWYFAKKFWSRATARQKIQS
ncbi:hypothetical protein BLX41_25485 [Pseudomonas protegens]|uniref:hypothetical protein n=1 Tax=Pseudomonas protegens TaxID=380021 RepID=UPI000F4B1533|nr:hypothetical protein [Pseudomonas protegens]ROL65702.1 hypothetical protein BLX41_25485 [Pseudomonas protegens]